MSYSVYNWFDDNLAPRLKGVMKNVKKNEKAKNEEYDPKKEYIFSFDLFMNAIKEALLVMEDERFISQFLQVLLNPHDEEFDLSDYIKEFFYKCSSWYCDASLSKLEYRKDASTTVSVNFQDFEETNREEKDED
jgi:hypothetical protein